jgi:hypothetical protein
MAGAEVPGGPLWSVDVFRRAAEKPYAPERLLRVADLVREGGARWEDVAAGKCEHFLVQMLSTPKARETLWPVLAQVAEELEAECTSGAEQERTARFAVDDTPATWLVDSFELPDPRWREGEVYGRPWTGPERRHQGDQRTGQDR